MDLRKAAEPGSVEAKDPFASAPPGHSLTQDNSRWAWGNPPQIADPEQALNEAIASLKTPRTRKELVKLLAVRTSIEVLVEGYILQSFQEGKFTPDVGILIKGPLALVLANVAEEEGIPYRFFENDNELQQDEMDDATFYSMMKRNNPAMFAYVREMINRGIREGKMPKEVRETFLEAGE